MEEGIIKIDFDNEVESLFIHKPYNFKRDVISLEERTKEINEIENVDGLITNLKGITLGTYVADCQSILLYDTKNKVIGNIHSGWKGTLSRISTKAINIMVNKYNSSLEDIKVYISPSIHKCHFEVGEELKELFENEFEDIILSDLIQIGEYKEEQKYYIDTVKLNKRVLINLGIKESNISSSEICSVCNNNIHSYRRDKPNDGRNLVLITIKNN